MEIQCFSFFSSFPVKSEFHSSFDLRKQFLFNFAFFLQKRTSTGSKNKAFCFLTYILKENTEVYYLETSKKDETCYFYILTFYVVLFGLWMFWWEQEVQIQKWTFSKLSTREMLSLLFKNTHKCEKMHISTVSYSVFKLYILWLVLLYEAV